jgi:hypothetical protein
MGYVFWEESKYFLEKALELAPNNSRAWDLLKKIEK